MNLHGVEIFSHDDSGFAPLMSYEGWRVALLNHQPSQERGKVTFVERHHETDEVFVLLEGSASLLLAGDGDRPTQPKELPLARGRIYNVPRNLWHAVISWEGSKLLIVENEDTGKANSSYCDL